MNQILDMIYTPKKLINFFVLILSVPLMSYVSIPNDNTITTADSSYQANSSSYQVNSESSSPISIDSYYSCFYSKMGDDVSMPDYEVFKKALTGFFNLKAGNSIENNLLTIIDFSSSSNQERMWIIDMNKMQIVHSNLVAHGRNSGNEFANHFSNIPSSYQSSLGFYLTDKIYQGKHGMSLYLDGVEPEINDKARERAIVMHSANYVSNEFVQNYGRLGRSLGCPAIPMLDHEKIISMLSDKSCIFIYYPDDKYKENSQMLNKETALTGMNLLLSESPGILDS